MIDEIVSIIFFCIELQKQMFKKILHPLKIKKVINYYVKQ